MRGTPGTCRSCLRRREVFPITRKGGGTYRRGGRTYRSSICLECARDLIQYAGTHAGALVSRFSVRGLHHILESQEPSSD